MDFESLIPHSADSLMLLRHSTVDLPNLLGKITPLERREDEYFVLNSGDPERTGGLIVNVLRCVGPAR